MKTRFIINPISGTGKQKYIEDYIRKHLNHFDIVYTKKSGDATVFSINSVEEGFDSVVAVGGDGTVNECLVGLVNTQTALGVIPCGSGNGFANHIGMKHKIEEAIIQLKNTHIKQVDTCTVNRKPFLNVSGVGFDAHIASLFDNLKERGFINYAKLILNELNYKPQNYILKYNYSQKEVTAYLIAFANASQYGNNAKISPLADIQNGLLDVVIIKKFPKWQIPFFLLRMIRGKTHLSKYVKIIRCKEIQITTNETLLHLDGEPFITENPIEIKIVPKSLKILMPNGK